MKGNVTTLAIKGQSTFGQLLDKAVEETTDEQKALKVISGIIILETDKGVCYFNLQKDTVLNLIGLLEVAKSFFVMDSIITYDE
jgi:hypothetical protein